VSTLPSPPPEPPSSPDIPQAPPLPAFEPKREASRGFDPGKTQPIKPLTAEDVLDVFLHFKESLLDQIDKRDSGVVRVLHDFQDAVMEKYEEWREEQDTLKDQIGALRRWKHERANKFEQQTVLRLDTVERELRELKGQLVKPPVG